MATQKGPARPNPELILTTLNAYQRTAALKAAIELDIFTALGAGANSVPELAKRCQAMERGMRILCDYLVIIGFLTKDGGQYALTPDSSMFLDRGSPACIASMSHFLTLPQILDNYRNLAGIVRSGHPTQAGGDVLESENPIWVEFARSMAPLQTPNAEAIAAILNADAGSKWKVLDIAAGHGAFGIAIAKHNPNAEIFALDWPSVLAVAQENARAASVLARYHAIPGSAFQTDFGSLYDVILLTGFLHHIASPTIESLLRKVYDALRPDGCVVTLEFVPNEDRVSPAAAASFSMVMLGSTPGGDAYPFSEYERMFRNAGFGRNDLRPLPGGPQSLILSRK